MKAKAHKRRACLAAAFILLFILLPVLENLVDRPEKSDPTSEIQVMEKDLYQNDGLGGESELSGEVLYSDNKAIIYPDRLLRKFSFKQENIENIAAVIQGIKKICLQEIGFYILPVPLRINVSEEYDEEEELYEDYLRKLQNTLPEEAALINVMPELKLHADEYIFFRTEDTWTARGAYYGSGILCEALKKTPCELSDYEEYMYNSFYGNLWNEYQDEENLPEVVLDKIAEMTNDSVYYYLLPGDKNRKAVLKNGKWVKMPAVTPSKRGIGTFTGGEYQAAVIEGNGTETILLICDDDGALLAPYLTGYYKQIYVVNITEYENFSKDLNEIVSQYGIRNVIWAQSALEMGDSGYSSALNDFRE